MNISKKIKELRRLLEVETKLLYYAEHPYQTLMDITFFEVELKLIELRYEIMMLEKGRC